MFSGFVLGFSISSEILPMGSPVLALFALVPLYVATWRMRSAGESFLVWFMQALTVHLVSSWWLANFHDYALLTLGSSALATAAMAGMCGMIAYMLPQSASPALRLEEDGGRRPLSAACRILWFCSCYTFWEWIKSTDFLAYPWGTLPMAAYGWRVLAQTADITGVWGISFLMSMTSAVLGEGTMLLGKRPLFRGAGAGGGVAASACALAALYAVSLCYGAVQLALPRTPEKTIRTVIVQPNLDSWTSSERETVKMAQRLTEEQVERMRSEGREPDLVLWNEGMLAFPFPEYRDVYQSAGGGGESLVGFINRMGVPFVIGGTVNVNPYKFHMTNSALFFDAGGNYAGFYAKTHLVPFAEEIPYADSPLMRAFMLKVAGFSSGWHPGNQLVLFKVPVHGLEDFPTPLEYRDEKQALLSLDRNGLSDREERLRFIENTDPNPDSYVTFSVPICFEDAFSDVCAKFHRMGSEVFMNITNDSWSLSESAEYQHFIAASYRAIEYRTTLVRCANGGYSAVVDAAGRIVADLPPFTPGAAGIDVPVYRHTDTVYSVWGNWFAYMQFALMALIILCLLERRERLLHALLLRMKADAAPSGLARTAPEEADAPAVLPAQGEADGSPEEKAEAAPPARKTPSARKKSAAAKEKKPQSKESPSRTPAAAKEKAAPAKKAAPARKATAKPDSGTVRTAAAKKKAPSTKAAATTGKGTAPKSAAKKTARTSKATAQTTERSSASRRKQ